MSDQLPILYQQIADMTSSFCNTGAGECGLRRQNQYRCCEKKYCEVARKFAKEKYDIDLHETGNPDLPFMGENGCTVAPHLRPLCSMHICSYSYAADVRVSPEGYEPLRDEILAEAEKQKRFPRELQ
jgi:hypothetical protein